MNTSHSIFEPLEDRRMFSSGALDPSFANGGFAYTNFGGVQVNGNAVAVQPNGKTVIVGGSVDGRFALARLNVDGTLDQSFGSKHDGQVLMTPLRGLPVEATAVAIQSDGKIIVAGKAVYTAVEIGEDRHVPYFEVDRFNSDGSLDKRFQFIDIGSEVSDVPSAIAIQKDGKVVVVGSSYSGGLFSASNNDMAAVRYNANGTIDRSFGDNGKRLVGFGSDEFATSVAIDYNGTAATNPYYGTIVMAGYQEWSYSHDIKYMAVARLTSSGSVDNRFDRDGRVLDTFNGQPVSVANGVIIQPGGKIVVGGAVATRGITPNNYALARFGPSGGLDSTFGSNGTGRLLANVSGSGATDLIQSSDGGLLLGGKVIAKFTANGLPKSNFGQNGVAQFDMTSSRTRLTPAPNGKFVAVESYNQFIAERFIDVNPKLTDRTRLIGAKTRSTTPASMFSETRIDDLLNHVLPTRR
jgi:uncharacterized delta-60 repeat protein